MSWEDDVRAARAGEELLAFLQRRLANPYREGPRLNDRAGEGPEEVFERLAEHDDAFQDRLEETMTAYFRSDASAPTEVNAHGTVRGMLEIVARRALTGLRSPLRGWLSRHRAVLQDEPVAALARAALAALAVMPAPGSASARAYWLDAWRAGPESWQPHAFMGLRRQDPAAAAEEIPELVRRAQQPFGPGPLLLGMWNQTTGRPALLDWLASARDTAAAYEVRRALRALLPPQEHNALRAPTPRRVLRPMSPTEAVAYA
jgi:hypothetical protein